MYTYNREPFDEVAGAVVTRMRKPVLKGTEWLERHDVDPETMVLDLPADMIFGPLDLNQQMKFLLAALKADNELADGYLARIFIDYMDLSLDPPMVSEKRLLDNNILELLSFACEDFSDTRPGRKHKFFHPDVFLRLVNWIAPHPEIVKEFVDKHDGVQLVLDALRFSKEDYGRVLAMRSLCLFSFTQKNDGDIERNILQRNGVKAIVDCYKQSSGDPTDTRSITILLSSILRHFPAEGGKEFFDADGVEATVNNLNVGRYKGFPQHLRVLHDCRKVPKKSWGEQSPEERILDADFIPVAFGVMDAFPEFYEVVGDVLYLMNDLANRTTPFTFLEYRAFPVLAKVYVRYMEDKVFQTDGTRRAMAKLANSILNDPKCKRALDPSVASHELQAATKTLNDLVKADKENRITSKDTAVVAPQAKPAVAA